MKPKQKRIDKGMWWDRAWGLVQGCTKVSGGCLHCWSETEANMRGRQKNPGMQYRWGGCTGDDGKWNGNIRTLDKYLMLPTPRQKPVVWSVWNDLFHKDVPDTFILNALQVAKKCPQHLFLILTKRIERAKAFFIKDHWAMVGCEAPLPNVMLGTTVEDQNMANLRVPILLRCNVAGRFLSVEPMLGPVAISPALDPTGHTCGGEAEVCRGCGYCEKWMHYDEHGLVTLDGVICGGESGRGARPMDAEWARSLRDQCQDAGVPFWLKQMGGHPDKRAAFSEIPEDLRIREFLNA